MKKIYRHGDILLKAIKLNSKLKSLGKFNQYVLAEGETTGHKHTLVAKPQTYFEVLEDEKGQKYLKLEREAELTHQEHKTIKIMPDFYVIGNEREFSYEDQELKKIQD